MPNILIFSYSPQTQFTGEEQSAIQNVLQQKLGPTFISQRNGPGGQRLAYIEGWRIITLANEIFGFNGWSHSVTDQTIGEIKRLGVILGSSFYMNAYFMYLFILSSLNH